MKSWIVFLTAAAVCAAQQDCWRGACYPPSGDLLLGREQNLKASSTCGLMGSEVICTPHGQWKMKCCPCDSRYPGAYNAHTIQNVLSSAGPIRWWQSKKDENPVTLQFDLNGMYQLETLFLSFKGPRPDALVIERTRDFGRTWQPVLYMATDCPSAFPQVDTSLPRSLDDTYCYALPPTADEPYRDQKVHYYPVRQYENINLPNDYKIEVLSGFTGLRVNLTQLGPVPSMPGRSLSQFYALREMRVIGSCFCHGHASSCLPDNTDNYLFNTQVGGACDCQHNTAGVNCERCDEFYNDLPWRPAENSDTHTCKRCECNNHAERCHFDPPRYEETGRRSGGVCDGCMHHTTGPNCERCVPNYYPNPRSDMKSPDACLRCQCDSAGSLNSGQCDVVTGRCVCKAHVEGENCDRCKAGYYNLNANNPDGCSRCVCSYEGAVSGACDQLTGQCVCQPHAEGLQCDRCAAGYWKSPNGCQPCDCDPSNSRSSTCDQVTGQCQCRYGFGGRTCGGCPENTFGDSRVGCRQCECDPSGTEPGGCDKRTGVCRCKPGVSGARCDACRRGHCASFPQCPACPDCFFPLNAHLQNLTLHLELLSNYQIPHSGESLSAEMNQRIRIIQNSLRQIQDSMTVPPASSDTLTETLQKLNTLKSQVKRLKEDASPRPSDPDLKRRLDELQDLLSSIQLEYFTKRDAFKNTAGSHNASTFNAIQNSYDTSTDAVKKAEATEKPLKNSSDIRENALKDLNRLQPVNTRDLLKLKEDLATRPDLRPAAQKVCGSTRTEPCTPQKCDGDVCPPAGAPPCGPDETCVGALPNANRALENAEEMKDKLQDLNDKITQALTQIQEAEDSANKARLSTDQLANKIKQVRSDVDGDLKDAKDFITTLKDFLSAPHSDPDEVQRVCEDVLEAKFPLSVDNLKQKLKEMQDLASSLPDSSKILESTKPELEKARKLLEEALNTRDAAFGIQQDADSVLKSIDENEDILKDLEDKIQQSLDIAKNVKQDVGKIEDTLAPAEKGIVGITDLVDEMRPLLDTLKKDVQTGTGLANDAQDKANAAQDEADQAAKDLEALKDEIEKLRQAAAENTEAGEVGDRVMNLVEDMSSLNSETANITTALRDKGAEIQQSTAELEEKAKILTGLEDKLREIRDDIRQKVIKLSMCQG